LSLEEKLREQSRFEPDGMGEPHLLAFGTANLGQRHLRMAFRMSRKRYATQAIRTDLASSQDIQNGRFHQLRHMSSLVLSEKRQCDCHSAERGVRRAISPPAPARHIPRRVPPLHNPRHSWSDRHGLYSDGFVSLRADHPVSTRKLSLKQFLQLEHAVIRAESRTEEVIERYLARKRIQRRVVLITQHFVSAPLIVAQSDLIVTVPEPLARYFSNASARVRVVGLPFEPPRIDLKQLWHRKFHHDARNRWLRAVTRKLFQKTRGRPSTG
jgi:Transcriptional regulator